MSLSANSSNQLTYLTEQLPASPAIGLPLRYGTTST
jgi:hypothetical protein